MFFVFLPGVEKEKIECVSSVPLDVAQSLGHSGRIARLNLANESPLIRLGQVAKSGTGHQDRTGKADAEKEKTVEAQRTIPKTLRIAEPVFGLGNGRGHSAEVENVETESEDFTSKIESDLKTKLIFQFR